METLVKAVLWIGVHIMVFMMAAVLAVKKYSFLFTCLVCLTYYLIMKWALRI